MSERNMPAIYVCKMVPVYKKLLKLVNEVRRSGKRHMQHCHDSELMMYVTPQRGAQMSKWIHAAEELSVRETNYIKPEVYEVWQNNDIQQTGCLALDASAWKIV